MARIFISHSSRDNERAAGIKSWLEQNGFEAPFLDIDKHSGLPPGSNWERELYTQIERALALIIVVTPNWLESKWCFAEFTQARALGKAIFPIVESPLDGQYVAPDIQHLDLVRDREGGLERLLTELNNIRLNTQGGFSFPPGRSPYPGLMAFDEADAAVYFGRDEEIRRLIEWVRARRTQGGSRLVAILGASGSGKSSLMRAGVLPRLRREPDQWIVVGPVRPLERPMEQLAMALTVAFDRTRTYEEVRSALEGDRQGGVGAVIRDLRLHCAQPNAFVVLAVDQGEELFSTAAADERRSFLQILGRIAAGSYPATALMTFRSDFLGRLQSDLDLASDFHDFKVGPLPHERIPQIIRGPAGVVGLRVEDEFVLKAARDASGKASLPLLAFALRELYERHGASGLLTLDHYERLGDAERELDPLENAVREAADRTIDKDALPANELRALRDAFIPALVRVDSDGEYVRRPASENELPAAAADLIERLLSARLLVTTERGGERVIEVAHEALLRSWPLLRSWLDEEREFLVGKEQLERDLADWRASPPDRKAHSLLTGLKLSRARLWLAERPDKLSEEERQFIRASIEEADRVARQRAAMRRAIIWGSVATSVVLALATYISVSQWYLARAERDQAQAALLSLRSQEALRTGRIYSALLLAHDAALTHSGPETRSALLQSLLNIPPELHQQASLPDEVPTLVVHPAESDHFLAASTSGRVISVDRRSLSTSVVFDDADSDAIVALSASRPGSLLLARESGYATFVPRNAGENLPPRPLKLGEWIVSADVNLSHGLFAFLAEGAAHAVVARCDVAAGVDDIQFCERWTGPNGYISAVKIDPTGRLIAFGTESGDVFLYHPGGEEAAHVVRVDERILSLAWDAAGRWLAVGTDAGTVTVIDGQTGSFTRAYREGSGVTSLAWNADATSLAGTCGPRGVGVCVWSRTNAGLLPTNELYGHRESVQSLGWSDGYLTSMGLDYHILVWAPDRPSTPLGIMNAPSRDIAFTDVDVARDDAAIAVGTAAGDVIIYDPETLGMEFVLRTGSSSRISAVSWDETGRRVAAADEAGGMAVWTLAASSRPTYVDVDNRPIEALVWLSGTDLVYAALRDGRVVSADVGRDRRLYSTQSHDESVVGLAAAEDGSVLISADALGNVVLWEPQTLEIIDTLESVREKIGAAVGRNGLSLTSDGRRLAAVGNDGRVLLYDVDSRTLSGILETDAIQIEDVAFSPDDELIAVLTSDSRLHVWTASGGAFATLDLKNTQSQAPDFWPSEPSEWRARKIAWADNRKLAVSTSAAKVLLINYDEGDWTARAASMLVE